MESSRARGWRAERGIRNIDELTAKQAAAYVVYLRDRGAAPATLRKVKTLFTSLRAFCEEEPEYKGLEGDELGRLRLPPLVERIPEAITEQDCLRLIGACGDSLRDRVIVETLLLAGLRVSELCAVTLDTVHLESRPAYIHVSGSVHNPKRPKTPQERRVIIDYDANGFGRGYVGRLRHYIESVREKSYHRELFLSQHK
ncbi:MAG: tyrosine-type recombinase/integrase, partial [Candidatus Dormibacterales bacterium]